MNRTQLILGGIAILVVIIWLVAYRDRIFTRPEPQANNGEAIVASFICQGGKSLVATFTAEAVALKLSDSRELALPHAVSADGARFANADESIVFWSKGNTAFLTEGSAQTYGGCVLAAQAPTGWVPYLASDGSFTVSVPSDYTPKESYAYTALGQGSGVGGVSFTIPAAAAEGTNLSKDTYISVETLPSSSACSASEFLEPGAGASAITDSGVTYSVATSTGAGAGNRYAEAVFSIPGTNPCIGIRYYIHSTVLENYPAGTVEQFNEQTLIAEFDAVRRTLVIGR